MPQTFDQHEQSAKQLEVSMIISVKPTRDLELEFTFGVPCSSTMLAFISIIPESRFPSIRAF